MPEVIVEGGKVHYLQNRPEKPRRPWMMVLVHGSGGNAGLWRKVMNELEEYNSIAIDLPGHGASSGEGKGSISEYRHFLKDFLDALREETVVLGGHSMGGAIVLDFALQYPEKLKALLLVGTGARLRVLPEVLEMQKRMAEGQIPPKFFPWGFAENAPPEVLSEGEKEWSKTNSRVRYQDLLACDQFDLMGQVEKIRIPTLIVCGKEDRLTPVKYSEFLQKKIAPSRMEVIENAGHMLMLEAPQTLSAVISKFLNSV